MDRSDEELLRRVTDFWFGAPGTPEHGTQRPIWFDKDVTFDAAIREEFARETAEAAAGRHRALAETPDGAVALVILLDQFPRNLHRDDPRAFACDQDAWRIAARAIGRGFDRAVSPQQRMFLYMPYQHAEDAAIQYRSVLLFHELGLRTPFLFAVAHRRIIERFGRFPHRNAILGRRSTPEEQAFLREPGSSF